MEQNEECLNFNKEVKTKGTKVKMLDLDGYSNGYLYKDNYYINPRDNKVELVKEVKRFSKIWFDDSLSEKSQKYDLLLVADYDKNLGEYYKYLLELSVYLEVDFKQLTLAEIKEFNHIIWILNAHDIKVVSQRKTFMFIL